MSKGKRRPIVKVRKRPEIVKDEEDNFVNFDHLQTRTKLLRKKFVNEYLKDFNASRALLRMGYKYDLKVANAYAGKWMGEAYTQYLIAEAMEKMDEQAIVDRKEVLLGLKREAHAPDVPFSSNASTRISALRSLAKILGMEIVKADVNMTIGGGVMAIPLSGSPEEWEKATQLAQAKLKEAVRK